MILEQDSIIKGRRKPDTELISSDSTKIDYSKIYDTGVIEADKNWQTIS